MLGRAHDAQATDRVVTRQDHHLHPLRARRIEGQQFFNQRKRHARLGRLLNALQLHLHVGFVGMLLKDLVFLFKVKQCPGRDGDNELPVKVGGHGDFCELEGAVCTIVHKLAHRWAIHRPG